MNNENFNFAIVIQQQQAYIDLLNKQLGRESVEIIMYSEFIRELNLEEQFKEFKLGHLSFFEIDSQNEEECP